MNSVQTIIMIVNNVKKVNYYFNLNSRKIRNSMMQQHNQFSQQLQHTSSTTKPKQQQSSPTAMIHPAQASGLLSAQHQQQQQNFIGQSHLRKLANATFTFKAASGQSGTGAAGANALMGGSLTGGGLLTQAQMMMANKLMNANNNQLQNDEGITQSQSYRMTLQNPGLNSGSVGNEFSAENTSSSTKSIPIGKKQQPTFSNVNFSSGRRVTASNTDEHQTVSAQKKKVAQQPSLTGAISLKISKKQGLTLNAPTSSHAGKTTGPQTTTNNSNVKYQGMKTTGAIISTIGTRDLSANSDRVTVTNPPGINKSLLKQKSRNRCNENLNIGGNAGTGSGVAIGAQAAESHGSSNRINNTNSNKETVSQGHSQILSQSKPGSGQQVYPGNQMPHESSSLKELKSQGLSSQLGNAVAQNNKNIHEKESSQKVLNNNAHSNLNSSHQRSQLCDQLNNNKNPETIETLKVDGNDNKNLMTLSLDRVTAVQNLNQTMKVGSIQINSIQGIANQSSLDTSVGNIAQLIPKKKIILQNTTQEKLLQSKNIQGGTKLISAAEKTTSTPTYQGSNVNTSGGFSQSLEKMTLSVDETSSLSNRAATLNQQQIYEKSPTINQKTRQISRINHSLLAAKANAENPQKIQQNTSSQALNIIATDSQGIQLQSERAVYLGQKLSLSHEYANSARDCEMSTTINYTHATGLNLQPEEALASQTMMVQSQSPGDGGSACSPQNQSTGKINFYPTSKNSSGILKRRTPASSQHIVSQHAPNQAKRKHQVKAESCDQQRPQSEDAAGASSPSAGAQNPNNVSSIGNKSQHYGLSSQSFLTNSNSNGGSNTRIPDNKGQDTTLGMLQVQTGGGGGGPGSSGVNTSSLSSSFFTHQRQKSSGGGGGGFTGVLSNIKSSNKKTNSSLQPQAAHNIGLNTTIQGTNIVFRAGNNMASTKKAIVGQHDTDMKATKGHHHSTLSQTKIEVTEPISLSSRPSYNDQQPHLQPTSSGQVILKNASKSGLKFDISKRGDTSSRSNSIRKGTKGIIQSGSKKALKNNFVTSSVNKSDNPVINEPISPTSQERNISQDKYITNQCQYNHTVEDMDNVDSLDQSLVQASFSKEGQPPSVYSSTLKSKKVSKKDVLGNLNRSVVVEPSSSQINNSLIKQFKRKPEASGAKLDKVTTLQDYEIFEVMQKELKNKDLMIKNLRDRLVDLEERVNGIQSQNQRQGRNRAEEIEDEDTQRARDKSQQRIKEAIINLERKLEQFRMEKELHNLRLEELKQYSSSHHSSSRQSDLLMNQRSHQTQQQYLQTILDAGLNIGPFGIVQGRTPQHNIPSISSNDGGFATQTLGAPRRRQKSRNSLIEDLESLITIGENDDQQLVGGANLIAMQNQLFNDQKTQQALLNLDGGKKSQKHLGKIKTPMFEDDLAKLCQSSSDEQSQGDDSHLKIIAQGGDMNLDEDGEGQDNSCLLMLEKEWQEAQRQNQAEDNAPGEVVTNFISGTGANKGNISNLFDQSLISPSNNVLIQGQMAGGAFKNNQTQNNIVFFFDEEETMQQDDEDDIERYVEPIDELAHTANQYKEKFVKTQKIEFSQKERASLGMLGARKLGREKGDSSLSPASNGEGGRMIQVKKLKMQPKQSADGSIINEGQPTFSRTLSKTQLLEKIRNAIGKQDKFTMQQKNEKASPSKKIQQVPINAGPRRFVVKRSQERNTSSTQIAQQNQPAKLKTQVGVLKSGRPDPEPSQGVDKIQPTGKTSNTFHQQEQLMKTIVQQKEKIAQTQKDALKKERELSLQLRQAIQKLNLKIQHNAVAGGSIKNKQLSKQ